MRKTASVVVELWRLHSNGNGPHSDPQELGTSTGHGLTPIIDQTLGNLVNPPVVLLSGYPHAAGCDGHLELILVVDEPGLVAFRHAGGIDAGCCDFIFYHASSPRLTWEIPGPVPFCRQPAPHIDPHLHHGYIAIIMTVLPYYRYYRSIQGALD